MRHGGAMKELWRSHGHFMLPSWETHGKFMENSWETHRKFMENTCESRVKKGVSGDICLWILGRQVSDRGTGWGNKARKGPVTGR